MPPDAEQVVLFPTAGWPHVDGQHWVVPIHARVTSAKVDSRRQRLLIRLLRRSAGIEPNGPQAQYLKDRMSPFLQQEMERRTLCVQFGETITHFGPTDAGGHAHTRLMVPRTLPSSSYPIRAWLQSAPKCYGQSQAQLLETHGWSLISDIDDTIKLSDVRNAKALLKNTFAEPFQAIPGMATQYQSWAQRGVAFHYVSSSPWQLIEPLRELLNNDGFPFGSMHLKQLRIRDRSAFRLLQDPKQTKPPVLQSILDAWPERHFLLVGDSGEQDPEIYCRLAAERPHQIQKIYIRLLSPTSEKSARWEQLSKDLRPGTLQTFHSAAALQLPLSFMNGQEQEP